MDLTNLSSLITFVIGGVTVATPLTYWQTVRGDKRAEKAEKRAETTGQVDAVTKLLADNLSMQEKLTSAFDQIRAGRTEAAEATAKASQAHALADDVRAKFFRLVTAFRSIVTWLDDGAHGEPPHVPDEIRRLLDETDPS